MVTHFPDLELSILPHSDSPETTESLKAWHFLSLLLSIRRPATTAELAFRCTLFPATPDLVEYLCSIRNSPIFLTADLLVTPSPFSLMAIGELISNSNLISVLSPRVGYGGSRPIRLWEGVLMCSRKRGRIVSDDDDDEFTPVAKRRIFFESGNEGEAVDRVGRVCPLPRTIPNDSVEVLFRLPHDIIKGINEQHYNTSSTESDPRNFNKATVMPSLLGSSSSQQLTCKFKNVEQLEGCSSKNLALYEKVQECVHISECQHNSRHINSVPNIPRQITADSVTACEPNQRPNFPTMILGDPIALEEANDNAASPTGRPGFSNMHCLEEVEENNAASVVIGNVNNGRESTNDRLVEGERITTGKEVEILDSSGCHTGEYEKSPPESSINLFNVPPKNDHETMNTTNCMIQSMEKEQRITCAERQLTLSGKSHAKMKPSTTPLMQALCKSVEHSNAAGTSKEKHDYKRNQMSVSMKQKLKQNQNDAHNKERKEKSTSVSVKDQMEPKAQPKFESFIVEEEEGSGGYGTVYRARRKSDGITVAIKYPHAKAHKHHVTNELKMLERFGGKHFVIKYEGCFKSNDSDCFVLEHVEHDRPEVLKKDIDVYQLQWYGYCMFKALASLHKQGVVHRDVKPGNFLFSRKSTKGYLIDFNLAMDLHQKYGTARKANTNYDVNSGHSSLPSSKSMSPRKFPIARSAAIGKESRRSYKSNLEKDLKKKVVEQKKPYNALGGWNKTRGQGADGSGMTSTRDVTSTRTPSAERRREPLPSQGRKELLNLLHEAMQTPSNEVSHVPAPLRKRIAATPRQPDNTLFHLSPMPLHSTSLAVAGAGLMKNKGDGKLKQEGPCVGTKGFRAPEVLLRSLHQGPKVDVWSAGVTLLYYMTGRTPFHGDPEQNIKEIAQLRGSEDLWEVAKLHNREASFPMELYDVKFLSSLKLRDWCEANTKRPDLFKVMPRSLFDLVDKCLTVNPRRRISAEEALRHDFFAPCQEVMKRQKHTRLGLSLDSGATCSSSGHRPPTPKAKVGDEQAFT